MVGNDPQGAAAAFAGPGITVTGTVVSTLPFLHQARVSVAPLRYGAGMKGKVGEALATGLPVVLTSVAAEGMGLVDGEHVLVADTAEAFAAAVQRLCTDAELWRRLRDAGRGPRRPAFRHRPDATGRRRHARQHHDRRQCERGGRRVGGGRRFGLTATDTDATSSSADDDARIAGRAMVQATPCEGHAGRQEHQRLRAPVVAVQRQSVGLDGHRRFDPSAQPGHQGTVSGKAVDGRGELLGVSVLDQQAVASVLDDVGDAPDPGGDDGQSGRLGLHDGLGPVVVPARRKDGDVHVRQDAPAGPPG